MDDLCKEEAFKDHAVIFVHTINPYGMAWWRRFNENNVDLNRNFLTRNQKYSGVPEGYEHIREFINPESPPPKKEKMVQIESAQSNSEVWI